MNKFFGFLSSLNKDEKIDDRSMLAHTVVTAVVIVLCLAAMSLTAYAYFSYSIASNLNTIISASFDVSVRVEQEGNTISNVDNKYVLGKNVYDITVTGNGSAEKGFCIVYAVLSNGTKTVYHTQQLTTNQSDGTNTLNFSLDLTGIPEETVSVEFVANWGSAEFFTGGPLGRTIYSNDIVRYGEIMMSVPPSDDTNGPDTSDEPSDDTDGPDVSDEPSDDMDEPDISDEPDGESGVSQEIVYTVASGDNLTKIANKYGSTVKAIQEKNNIEDPNLIYVDQKLIIPVLSE